MTERQKCIGIWGRLFGHRFTVKSGAYSTRTEYCGRCGMLPYWGRKPNG